MRVIKCRTCREEIQLNGHRGEWSKVFCSAECQRSAYNLKSFTYGFSPSTVGAISELLVSADLMKKGFEVFRALSPSCSCDLIAAKKGRLLRVEVRTGQYNRQEPTIYYKQTDVKGDLMAVVTLKDERVHYIPESLLLDGDHAES